MMTRPLQETRHWGEYTVLHQLQSTEGASALTKHLVLQPGKNISYQYHHHRSEVWVFIQGNGTLVLEGELLPVAPGVVVEIPALTKHSLQATSELHFIEVQRGFPLVEEDIVRLAVEWQEILKLCQAQEA